VASVLPVRVAPRGPGTAHLHRDRYRPGCAVTRRRARHGREREPSDVAVLPGGGLSDGGPTTSAKITPSGMAVLPRRRLPDRRRPPRASRRRLTGSSPRSRQGEKWLLRFSLTPLPLSMRAGTLWPRAIRPRFELYAAVSGRAPERPRHSPTEREHERRLAPRRLPLSPGVPFEDPRPGRPARLWACTEVQRRRDEGPPFLMAREPCPPIVGTKDPCSRRPGGVRCAQP
jgi:hypothetical protein